MITYTAWLSIQISHPYFSDSVCSALSCKPTVASQRWMAGMGLLFRPQPGGGTLYYTDESRLLSFDIGQALEFSLLCSDQNILNYTDFDYKKFAGDLGSSLFYFNNLSSEQATLLPDLQSAALNIWPAQYRYTPAKPAGDTYFVRDSLRGDIYWQGTPGGDGDLHIDMEQAPAARYVLYDGEKALAPFYMSDRKREWGIIAIYLGGSAQLPFMKNACPAILASGIVPNPVYTLPLAQRQTTWRYRIYSQSSDQHIYDQYQVVGQNTKNKQQRQFGKSNPGKAGDPWLFTSDDDIPVQERPEDWEYFLCKQNSTRNKVMLSYARGGLLVLPAPDGGYFSDIYVYL